MFLFQFFWIIPLFIILSILIGGILNLLFAIIVGALFGNVVGLSIISLLCLLTQNPITVDDLIKAVIFCSIGGAVATIGCFITNGV